jgi:indolepyruvate ferredoxin oxidoreductase beta subunit
VTKRDVTGRDVTGRTKILFVGVGGQGVLTAARMLGEAALAAGIEPMVGQLHGMAQRGGSVEASVLLGPGESAFIEAGGADVLVGLEPMEALRALPRLSGRSQVVVNRGAVVPFPLSMRGEAYPDLDAIADQIRAVAPQTLQVEGTALLEQELGHARSLNMLMLGVLAELQLAGPLARDAIFEAMRSRTPPRLLEVNERAFALGEQAARDLERRPTARLGTVAVPTPG